MRLRLFLSLTCHFSYATITKTFRNGGEFMNQRKVAAFIAAVMAGVMILSFVLSLLGGLAA